MTTIVTRSGKGSSLSWSEVDSNFTNLNTDKAETDSPTFTGTVSGITKAMVGLGNVDNTSDVNKPISTATQTSLDLRVSKDSDTGAATLPSGTTAQRSSIGAGKVRFNSTIGIYEGYNTATSSWDSLGGIVNTQTVGISSTASENHFWDGSVPNQLSLKQGTPAAPGAVVLGMVNGKVNVLNNAQTWQSPTRSLGVTYTNNTGQPIQVSFSGTISTTTNRFVFSVEGLPVAYSGFPPAINAVVTIQGILVPAGATYAINHNGGTPAIDWWMELR